MGRFEHFGRCLDRCESVLELRFLSALIFSDDFGFEPHFEGVAIDPRGVVLHQQLQLGAFRVDFAFTHAEHAARLVVELDGHEFHERTPEQAERDRSRDRVLLEAGWQTIRFTGREITRAQLTCAADAMRIYNGLLRPRPGLAKAEVRVVASRRLAGT